MHKSDEDQIDEQLAPLVARYRTLRSPGYLVARITANYRGKRPRVGLPAKLYGAVAVMVVLTVLVLPLMQRPGVQPASPKYPSFSMLDLSSVSKSKVRIPSGPVHVPLRPPTLPSKPPAPDESQGNTVSEESIQYAVTKEYENVKQHS